MKLQLRVGDVEFWKGELDNKLAQLKEEIEEAVSMKYVEVFLQPTRNVLFKDSYNGEPPPLAPPF